MQSIKHKVSESLILIKKKRWYFMLKPLKGTCSSAVLSPERLVSDVGSITLSSTEMGKNAVDMGVDELVKRLVLKSGHVSKTSVDPSSICKDALGTEVAATYVDSLFVSDINVYGSCPFLMEMNGCKYGNPILSRGWWSRECLVSSWTPFKLAKYRGEPETFPCFARSLASSSASQSSGQTPPEKNRKDISTVDDPFDAPTYNIPEKPVTFVEGASYSVIILVGLGIAAAAGYAAITEVIFQPKEYKIFGKALERVQNDSQVRVRIGSPVRGYGQESRN
ncbi:hypothetical protein NE237_011547 [Protea cynaroides]|uniref:Mitochondrial import inner membrane translocase subunit Tim21 n=1 Tax=Protea cynaroides TaxID=273540 RepID=A0A9Q0GW98_9MAGN|nr:hypothetical protein NE237_011547 [Protea cynaroides]